MILLLNHPDAAAVSCDSCERWMFSTDWSLHRDRNGDPIPRPPNARKPCRTCPKCEHSRIASPAVGRQRELSPRNRRTLELYHQQQACPWPTDAFDEITRNNFGIIHEMFDEHDRAIRKLTLNVTAGKKQW